MSYYGWDCKDDSDAARKLLGTLVTLRKSGTSKDLIFQLIDSDMSFDENADLVQTYEAANLKQHLEPPVRIKLLKVELSIARIATLKSGLHNC